MIIISVKRFGTFKRINPVTPVAPKDPPIVQNVANVGTFASKEIRDLVRRIDVPQTQLSFPKWKPNKADNDHLDYKNQGYLANYDFYQTLELADALGLRLPSFQETLDQSKRPGFTHWMWTNEVIVQDQGVLTNVYPVKVGSDITLEGIMHKVKTKGSVPDILERAKLYTPIKGIKVNSYNPAFDNKGYASVWSYWNADVGCFIAIAIRPSCRFSSGLPGFCKSKGV